MPLAQVKGSSGRRNTAPDGQKAAGNVRSFISFILTPPMNSRNAAPPGRHGVLRAGYGPAHDDVVRAELACPLGRRDAHLVALFAARRSARRASRSGSPRRSARARRAASSGEQTTPSSPAALRVLRVVAGRPRRAGLSMSSSRCMRSSLVEVSCVTAMSSGPRPVRAGQALQRRLHHVHACRRRGG